MRNRYYRGRGTVEYTKWVLGYLLSRYRDDKSIDWLRERIKIIPFKAVWK